MDKCKICKSDIKYLFKAKVLKKYKASYYKCKKCGFIQTEKPFWLKEAYSLKNTYTDTGYVSRNINFSNMTENIIEINFDYNGKFIDYGAGYGLFVRLMRDKGFHFYWHDIYENNIFAFGFDVKKIVKNNYELLIAFEVFEHLVDPVKEIKKMFKFSNNILFSTALQPDKEIHNINDWWYFAPEGGQHISFYTLNSLEYISRKFNAYLFSNGNNIHLLSKTIKKFKFPSRKSQNIMMRIINKIAKKKTKIKERKSLTQSDYEFIKENF
ncbi:MAG: class I SAM-dependent methyltransferase [Bacteroidales bacterium]|nr:class I SAM-dependent methyltransferase [Bacteroidales bacterium]